MAMNTDMGGLGRCAEERAAKKLCDRMAMYLSGHISMIRYIKPFLQRSKQIKNEDQL